MVFINPIMTTHVNKTTNQPLMNSITIGRYKITYDENPNGGYQKPFVAIVGTLDHGNGHYVKAKQGSS
jgi:hypothetical protein